MSVHAPGFSASGSASGRFGASTPVAPPPVPPSMWLTFQVGAEEYGVEITKVVQIIGMLPVTPVPGCPPVVLGVVNQRGRVIPVLSMRVRFGLPPAPADPHNVIILVEHDGQIYGLAVDQVRDVVGFTPGDIDPSPAYGLDSAGGLVQGIGRVEGGIRILLELARVLAFTAPAPAEPPGAAIAALAKAVSEGAAAMGGAADPAGPAAGARADAARPPGTASPGTASPGAPRP
jgi:purine-binding chemotaxis protein CheW